MKQRELFWTLMRMARSQMLMAEVLGAEHQIDSEYHCEFVGLILILRNFSVILNSAN